MTATRLSLPVHTETLPCGTCRACCQGFTLVAVHEEFGDDPSLYDAKVCGPGLVLRHKPNGDCIHLDRATGCTVYDRRPMMCRAFNCVESARLGHELSGPVKKAARKMGAMLDAQSARGCRV